MQELDALPPIENDGSISFCIYTVALGRTLRMASTKDERHVERAHQAAALAWEAVITAYPRLLQAGVRASAYVRRAALNMYLNEVKRERTQKRACPGEEVSISVTDMLVVSTEHGGPGGTDEVVADPTGENPEVLAGDREILLKAFLGLGPRHRLVARMLHAQLIPEDMAPMLGVKVERARQLKNEVVDILHDKLTALGYRRVK